jgi:hypothetical protein
LLHPNKGRWNIQLASSNLQKGKTSVFVIRPSDKLTDKLFDTLNEKTGDKL